MIKNEMQRLLSGKACTESTWKKYENQSSAGASLYASAKTVQECQKYCVDNPSCVGVDVNVLHDPPTCWPHYSIEKWQKDNIANHHGIIQYRLVQRCDHADSPNGSSPAPEAVLRGENFPAPGRIVFLFVDTATTFPYRYSLKIWGHGWGGGGDMPAAPTQNRPFTLVGVANYMGHWGTGAWACTPISCVIFSFSVYYIYVEIYVISV